MTRQNIYLGAAANDGTGDTLRNAGQKINQNFVDVYMHLGGDSDGLPGNITVTANSTLSLAYNFYILNKATALAITLPSGTYVGERKTFINTGAGVATVTANLAGTSVSFALAQYEGCQTIWSGSEWYLIGNQSVVTLA